MPKVTRSKLKILMPLVALVVLAACASSPPQPEVDFKPGYDFKAVSKIAFYDESGLVSGDNPILLSDMERERIDLALETALRNKGYQILDPKDAGQADLLISWHLATADKTDVRSYETPAMGASFGRYGYYNRYSMYNCWACMPTQTQVSVRNYTEGTFVVDMIDPKLRRSVWRSTIESRLKDKNNRDQNKYNAAAENIFAAFPAR